MWENDSECLFYLFFTIYLLTFNTMTNQFLSPTKSMYSYRIIWMMMLFEISSCVFSADELELYRRCSTPFSCGDQSGLFYPFWIPDRRDCGHPDFKLYCNTSFAEVSISSVRYKILKANYTSRVVRLARSEYIGDLCPQYPLTESFNQTVLQFAPGTEMLTIYDDCQDFSPSIPAYVGEINCEDDEKRYYVTRNLSLPSLAETGSLLDDFRRICRRNISIPASGPALNTLQNDVTPDNLKAALEQGFELGPNQDCSMCMNSEGACGYDWTSWRFLCYCVDAPNNSTCGSRKKGLSPGAKAGIGVASLLVWVILLAGGIFCLISRRRKMQADQYTRKDLLTTSYSSKETSSHPTSTTICVINCLRNTSDDLSQQNLKALIPLKQYSYAQVKRITKSFAKVVGKGGFGTVYKGTLCDGRSVAVKILKDSKVNNKEDFINEVASMSKTSHVNIVSLLGFCSEGSKRAIIYEYLENGSLDQFISSKIPMNIDWMALYGIALGVARGLEYLHHGCRTRIVHFDIKPQNILLDDNLCPKVSDFGLAKLCEKKESILSLLDTRGTIGYIAPEVFSRLYGRVSHKSDVYSYGMLVLEMIGARNKQRADENSASNASSMYFPEWIYKDLEKEDNGRLNENGVSNEEAEIAKKMTIVGLWCIQPSPTDRPPMNRVVEMMEGNVDTLEVPPRPVLQRIPPTLLQESSTLSEDSQFTEKYVSLNVI